MRARARADRDPGRARGPRARVGGRARRVRRARAGAAPAAAAACPRSSLAAVAGRRGRGAEPARAGRDRRRARGRSAIEEAAPALFSLPAPGGCSSRPAAARGSRSADGSKRLLGRLPRGVWSPFGRFVARRARERARRARAGRRRALDARAAGRVRSAPGAGPRRTRGSHTARGDGCGSSPATAPATGCSRAAPRTSRRPGARAPGTSSTYATRGGEVVTVDTGTGRVLWRRRAAGPVAALEWSSDGGGCSCRAATFADVLTRDGRPFTGFVPEEGRDPRRRVPAGGPRRRVRPRDPWADAGRCVDGEPGGLVFSGPGRIDELAWSPDGRWLLLGWRAADQWLFVRPGARPSRRPRTSRASSAPTTFPTLAGWCCASSP